MVARCCSERNINILTSLSWKSVSFKWCVAFSHCVTGHPWFPLVAEFKIPLHGPASKAKRSTFHNMAEGSSELLDLYFRHIRRMELFHVSFADTNRFSQRSFIYLQSGPVIDLSIIARKLMSITFKTLLTLYANVTNFNWLCLQLFWKAHSHLSPKFIRLLEGEESNIPTLRGAGNSLELNVNYKKIRKAMCSHSDL